MTFDLINFVKKYYIPLIIGIPVVYFIFFIFIPGITTTMEEDKAKKANSSQDYQPKKKNQAAQKQENNNIDPKIKVPNVGVLLPKSLGGTPLKPEKACLKYKCAIDFGDFILTNIDEDFAKTVEKEKFSGATAKLAALLIQIETILRDKRAHDTADQVHLLYVTSQNISLIEQKLEENIIRCGTNLNCLASSRKAVLYQPENFNTEVLDYIPDITYQDFADSLSFGYAKNIMINKLSTKEINNAMEPNDWLSMNYILQLEEIIYSREVDTSIKNVLKVISRNIGILAEDLRLIYNTTGAYALNKDSYSLAIYSPLDGKYFLKKITLNYPSGLQAVLKEYETYNGNNMDLVKDIICYTTEVTPATCK